MLPILRSLYQKGTRPNSVTNVICSMRDHHVWPHKKLLIRARIDYGKLHHLKLQRCDFRTTQALRIPPLVAILLRPALRIGTLLMGRGMKKWWARKSKEEKEQYKQRFRERSNVFLGCFALYGFILFVYYVSHLETDPLTKRKRFIIFNKEQEKMMGKMILDVHLQTCEKNLVPKHHPSYKKVLKIMDKILIANKDLKSIVETQWSLNIINIPLANSYILPGGHIFLSLDILKMIENDDQLGIVLAHEIAHSLLSHSLEALSDQVLLDFLIIVPVLLVWVLFPDWAAAVIHIIGERIVNVMYKLPYSRILENEADEVGIKLAAKTCIDVREAVVFWATMRTLTEMHLFPPEMPWISSHPSHEDREKNLNEIMTKALDLRKDSGCSVLPAVDPRTQFYKRSPREREIYLRQRGIIK